MFSFILSCIFNIKFIFTVILCVVSFHLFSLYSLSYWRRRNIYSPPTSSWLGHIKNAFVKIPITLRFAELYNENKDKPYFGVNIFVFKQLVVNDLDLVKNILLKDYSSFEGHGFKSHKDYDPLSQNLFNLEGEEWKKIRVKLTPTFTSSKMKYMYDKMYLCNEDMVDYLKKEIKIESNIDIKEIIAKVGTDVISSCAFGIETNAFKNPDSQFRKMGKKIFEVQFWQAIYDAVALSAPWISSRLPISRTSSDVAKFFIKVVEDTIDYREKNNINRNDFLQLLIDMKNLDKSNAYHMTMKEIIPQVFVFFAAGFETSATTVQYALLELAKHPDIRNTLVKQIDEVIEKNEGKFTYELVYNFQPLNEIINETLRMYPPIPILLRGCTKDYKIPNSNVVIENGTPVVIPVYGIHHDPDIYPEPEKFIPERFSPENAKSRHPFAHLPFGEGPRICIGNRFALMQSKLAIMILLRNFTIELSPKTQLPLKFDKSTFLLHTEGPMILKFALRK